MNGQLVELCAHRRISMTSTKILKCTEQKSYNHFHKLVFSFPIAHKLQKFYGIPRVTSVFKRARYCFLCTATLIQPTAPYPSYVDIHFNITLRISL
jgi:hypothetical protein